MSKYQGCTNCKFQPAPLQACNWLKVQTVYHTICPKWKPKNTDVPDINFGEWIPCSERLPEHEKDVLVSFKDETSVIAWYDEKDDQWKNSSTDLVINTAIWAWMPLPEPYSEEDK